MNTEVGFAYTLIESFALKHNNYFIRKALYIDYPANENSPNWNIYRLSKARMSGILLEGYVRSWDRLVQGLCESKTYRS